jgi:hypothetical protein
MEAHVEDPLSAELDALFQAAPSAMVEARNALADRLRKAGDKAGAARVKALKRPAPAAWALNQVHFCDAALLDEARAATEQVRALHARDAVEPRALVAAHETQREATKAVLDAAFAHCQAAGVPSSVAHQRRLLATLQALLTGAGSEGAGRLTKELDPSGFDAIESVGMVAPRAAAGAASAAEHAPAPAARVGLATATPKGHPVAPLATPDPDIAEQARLATRLAQRERALREAQAIAHKRRSARQRSEAELHKAREALAAAEREVQQRRTDLATREAEFQAANASFAAAETALRTAEAEVATARRERSRT